MHKGNKTCLQGTRFASSPTLLKPRLPCVLEDSLLKYFFLFNFWGKREKRIWFKLIFNTFIIIVVVVVYIVSPATYERNKNTNTHQRVKFKQTKVAQILMDLTERPTLLLPSQHLNRYMCTQISSCQNKTKNNNWVEMNFVSVAEKRWV